MKYKIPEKSAKSPPQMEPRSPPVVYQPAPPAGRAPRLEGYRGKASVGLGAVQVTAGIVCALLNVAALGLHTAHMHWGAGIWGGIFFIITGAIGIAAGKKKSRKLIIAFMVLSIFAAVISVFGVAHQGAAAVRARHEAMGERPYVGPRFARSFGNHHHHHHEHHHHHHGFDVAECKSHLGCKVTSGLMALVALLETIIAIASSAIACRGVCCRRRNTSVVNIQAAALPEKNPSFLYALPTNEPVQIVIPPAYASSPPTYSTANLRDLETAHGDKQALVGTDVTPVETASD